MAKTLREILGSKSSTEFEFVDLLKDRSQTDSSTILTFVLKTPLSKVTGRAVTDRATNTTVRLESYDVEEIRVGQETIEELQKLEEQAIKDGKPGPIQWVEEGKSGKVTCDIGLDVSNALQVWMTSIPFGQFGRNKRAERAAAQRSDLIEKMEQRKAERALKNADVTPETPEKKENKKPESVGK